MELRQLGQTEIRVSPIAFGCWPIAGMTSLGVTESDSLATLAACFELGINFLDTAYMYGRDGESERLIARAIGARRREMVIATKGGLAWNSAGQQQHDASPQTLRRQCAESLRRLSTDYIDLYYLHAPDPHTPLAETAAGLRQLLDAGQVRSIGVSNVTLAQLQALQAICPVSAVQPPYNMLQREIEQDLVPWCVAERISIAVYWPLLKGLLAGKLARDHQFPPGDGRPKYPMFQGAEWQKNQDFVDDLRVIAAANQRTVAELALAWTIAQPGITAALCGAKRPDQIRDNARGAGRGLSADERAAIGRAFARRGQPLTRIAVPT